MVVPASHSTAAVPRGASDTLPKSAGTFSFRSPSNLLARALHQAVVGSDTVSGDSSVSCNLSLALQLLSMSTPQEIAEAQKVMLDELGYNLASLHGVLTGQPKRDLERVLRAKGMFTGSEVRNPDDVLRREFLLREFERATIFPGTSIPRAFRASFTPPTIEDKLELLGEYLDFVHDAVLTYPRIVERWEKEGRGEHQADCPLWVLRSIREGRWSALGEGLKVRDVIEQANPRIDAAARTIEHYQQSLSSLDAASLEALVRNLDVVNQLALDYAMDLSEYAFLNLAQERPQGIVDRIFNCKPIDACNATWGAVFTRYFLVKRAVGVRQFADHMRASLRWA